MNRATHNTDPVSDRDIQQLLDAGRRHALARSFLLGFFALMSLGGVVLVLMIVRSEGLDSITDNGLALLLQAGLLAGLGTLIYWQRQQTSEFRARSQSVRDRLNSLERALQQRRRSSRLLLSIAALAPVFLVPAVLSLQSRGLIAGEQLAVLIGLCLLPSLVIAVVHGSRLWFTLPRQADQVTQIRSELLDG